MDGYAGVQCCGGQLISSADQCCGDEVFGRSYVSESSNYCCGLEYVDLLTTHCCTDDRGRSQVRLPVH